jgi:hypothetical protein
MTRIYIQIVALQWWQACTHMHALFIIIGTSPCDVRNQKRKGDRRVDMRWSPFAPNRWTGAPSHVSCLINQWSFSLAYMYIAASVISFVIFFSDVHMKGAHHRSQLAAYGWSLRLSNFRLDKHGKHYASFGTHELLFTMLSSKWRNVFGESGYRQISMLQIHMILGQVWCW